MDGEGSVSTGKVVAGGLWLVVAGLTVAAWSTMFATDHSWKLSVLLLGMSCVMAAVASVAQVHYFAVRLSSLIRATADVRQREGADSGPRSI